MHRRELRTLRVGPYPAPAAPSRSQHPAHIDEHVMSKANSIQPTLGNVTGHASNNLSLRAGQHL